MVHASAQHVLSTQSPDAHSPAPPHACPFAFLQLPAPSHAFGATHVPSVSPTATLVVHVPLAFAHDLHAVVHPSTQHVPSTQNPDAHSPAPPHACPFCFLHPPAPSHT